MSVEFVRERMRIFIFVLLGFFKISNISPTTLASNLRVAEQGFSSIFIGQGLCLLIKSIKRS